MDAAIAPLVEAFKVSYGGDKEDDVPAGGAKRPAGGAVRNKANITGQRAKHEPLILPPWLTAPFCTFFIFHRLNFPGQLFLYRGCTLSVVLDHIRL